MALAAAGIVIAGGALAVTLRPWEASPIEESAPLAVAAGADSAVLAAPETTEVAAAGEVAVQPTPSTPAPVPQREPAAQPIRTPPAPPPTVTPPRPTPVQQQPARQPPTPAPPRQPEPEPPVLQTPPRELPAATPPPQTPPPAREAEPPPAQPPAAPAATGRLFINSTPWGVVYIDGERIGNTPQINLAVPAGTHVIRIVRDGFQPFERQVEIAPDQVLRLTDITLVPAGSS